MQEIRHDGSEAWTRNPTTEQIEQAVRDERNATVAIHKAGSRVKQGGRTYEMNALGQWCRVGKQRRHR